MSNIVEDLNIQLVEKNKIKPFKDNPRTHSNEQIGFDESEILPMIDTNTVRDISGEWDNMPDFTQGDKTPDSTIFVHFTCDEDRQKFAALINQPVTEKTKTLWFPPQETMDTKNKIYE